MTFGAKGKGRHQRRISLRGQLAGLLVGTAGGMGVNVISSSVGYRGAATIAAAAAVFAATNWLRGRSRSRLSRYTRVGLLALALGAAVSAPVLPRSAAGVTTLVAAGLVASAILVYADLDEGASALRGIAFVGLGLGFIGRGVSTLEARDPLIGLAAVGLGAALFASGVALLRDNETLGGVVAATGGGTAAVVVGLSIIRGGDELAGGVALTGGVMLIGFSVMILTYGRRPNVFASLFGVMIVVGGLTLIVGGVAMVGGRQALAGAALIGVGVSTVGGGLAIKFGHYHLTGLAVVGSGTAFIGLGAALLQRGSPLSGMALIGVALAFSGSGIVLLRGSGLPRRIHQTLIQLTEDPPEMTAPKPERTMDLT